MKPVCLGAEKESRRASYCARLFNFFILTSLRHSSVFDCRRKTLTEELLDAIWACTSCLLKWSSYSLVCLRSRCRRLRLHWTFVVAGSQVSIESSSSSLTRPSSSVRRCLPALCVQAYHPQGAALAVCCRHRSWWRRLCRRKVDTRSFAWMSGALTAVSSWASLPVAARLPFLEANDLVLSKMSYSLHWEKRWRWTARLSLWHSYYLPYQTWMKISLRFGVWPCKLCY